MAVTCRECGKVMGPAHTQLEFDRRLCFECQSKPKEAAEKRSGKGLHGWLYALGVDVILDTVFAAKAVLEDTATTFGNGAWSALTHESSGAYNPLLANLVMIGLAVEVCLLAANGYLVYLFFQQRRSFPKLYITVAVLALAFEFLDLWFVSLIEGPDFVITAYEQGLLVWHTLATVAFVLYLLLSKRVKATFVK